MTVTELPRHSALPDGEQAGPDQLPRWTPARAGIINVWRYYDETFAFHRGRLLLRGPNGSGKSKALELLLPFLLDANLRASRLSTFGSGERTMHWNLMGEGAAGTTRVGYVWLEFQLSPDHWFTCGCRLQASTHTTTVHADYFTTSQQIATPGGVALVNAAGQPLTRVALEEALGDQGMVHGNSGDYRAAVRATLFPGLTEQRYDALITALLQLRTPKLSQRLDPALLSTLLSRALPPLGQQEITDLAEGFERLDRQRERLKTLDEDAGAARLLAARQRSYAQRVLRGRAAALISATTELDNLTKTARHSAEDYEAAAVQQEQLRARAVQLEAEIAADAARVDGITSSEAYQQGQELDKLRQRAARAGDQAAARATEADRCRSTAAADEDLRLEFLTSAEQQARVVTNLGDDAQAAARRASMTGVHQEIAGSLASTEFRPRTLLRAAVASRGRQLTGVRHALDDHDRKVSARQQAEAELDEARTRLAGARAEQETAARRHDQAVTELAGELTAWAAGCRELRFAEPAAFLPVVESETAVLRLISTAAEAVLESITAEETAVRAQQDAVRDEHDDYAAEIRRLASQQDLPPAAPPARTADRGAMTGAPLWRLVDFADHVPASSRGLVEAALQAAGLLDAWVGLTGTVEGHDMFADPAAVGPAPGRSLADILAPVPHPAVPTELVRRLLAAIAFGDFLPADHPAAIGADGTWRLASLHGSWHKERPEHIGALARQHAREQRITWLRGQIGACGERLADLDLRLAGLTARRAVVASERADRPRYRDVATASETLTRAESAVAARDGIVRERVTAVSSSEQRVRAALRALTALAAEHGLPADRAALDALATAIDSFRDQAEAWLDEHERLAAAREKLDSLTTQASRSAEIAGRREEDAAQARAERDGLAAMLSAVEATIGADWRDTLARLAGLRSRLDDLGGQLGSTRQQTLELAQRIGRLEAQRATDARARDTAVAARDSAAFRFRHLASGVFPADGEIDDLGRFRAGLAGSDGVRATLDAARQVAAAWPAIPYTPASIGDALHRLSESVHASRSSLSTPADLELVTDEDVQVFTAVVNGVRVGAAELLSVLRQEAERSRKDITESERELFDKTLTGDTRRHLADRIRQANELVDRMNARLERVRTASRVAVQLVWQVAADLPAGTRAARDLLLKDPVRLSSSDRESLHRFFRERIEQARADDTAVTWEQQLAQVFDYTSWHQFVVKVDRANGAGWQLLTRKLHGALSGGEKAIALHLPLFAAVAAHYQAVPEAPRIILLDEVFVGVDSSNRGQVFGLLSALDLDLVLTSDHEWCTYAELSGIGIHQLITGSDGDDAVTTARFTWDGTTLQADEQLRQTLP
ncbi:MAG TPA: TIGR02680 family protein [Streptosporangiaceae bacterium]|jgi:uncharacterized protein (TIGR02680 family)